MERRGAAYWMLLLLGAFALTNGLVMLAVPEPWFVRIAADTQSNVSDVKRARFASIWAFRSVIFCSASAMASPPAMRRPL